MKKILLTLSNLLLCFFSIVYASSPQQEILSEGIMAYQNKNYSQAMQLFSKADSLGHMKASRYIGLMWLNGEGVEYSAQKAVNAFRISAQRGDITSQYWLGYCYEKGIGVTQDYATALGWYLISAQRGDHIAAPAMQALANMYQKGLGVQADEKLAKYWQDQAEQAQNIQL